MNETMAPVDMPETHQALYVDMTPQLAMDWLRKSDLNRTMSVYRMRVYAQAMADGRWVCNGETVKRDREGRLIDGQHRLAAVIESGTTQRMLVVTGLDAEAKFTIDTGRARTADDAMRIAGVSDNRIVASAVMWTWRLCHDRPTVVARKRLDNDQAIAFLRQHPGLADSVAYIASLSLNRLIPQGVLASLHYLFAENYPKKADEFCYKLATGTDLKPGEPIYQLRRRLEESIAYRDRRIDTVTKAAYAIKAFALFLAKDSRIQLRWGRSESFPAIPV